MTSFDLTRRTLLSTAVGGPLAGALTCAPASRRQAAAFKPPRIVLENVGISAGRRFAVFSPKLVGADGAPAVAEQHIDATWNTLGGWAGHDYHPGEGSLHWTPGGAAPDGGDIVVAMGPASFNASRTYAPLKVNIHLGAGSGASPGYTDVSAACLVQVGLDQTRPAIWSLPKDQRSLDAIRPGQEGVLRSSFHGFNTLGGETGVDIHNGQFPGLNPFVVGPDQRVHLRCLALPEPIRDSAGKLKSIGQARLISPVAFQPGDLVEWDVQHVAPGWLVTWTSGEFGWPAGGEIDLEYRPDWCDPKKGLNLVEHYPGATASGLGGVVPLPDVDMNKPHVRSVEWTADGSTLIARINGVERQRWPMLWNGKPQIVIAQAAAYLPARAGLALPELSLGSWTHYRAAPRGRLSA